MPTPSNGVNIKVIGVGGGGVNAIDRMIQDGFVGVGFIATNTDGQPPVKSEAKTKLDASREVFHGLDVGIDPAVGRRATRENGETVGAASENAGMVSATVGEDGEAGTGAASVVAEIVRSIGALTVGVVTRPFEFEGRQRADNVAVGLAELRKAVDTPIVIPNDHFLEIAGDNLTILGAYHLVDKVLRNGVKGISDLTTIPGPINPGFVDVKAIMKDAGTVFMGIGEAADGGRVMRITEVTIFSLLLEASADDVHGVLLLFQSGENFSLQEMNQTSKLVQEAADPSANIILGHITDGSLGGVACVTVIAYLSCTSPSPRDS